MKMIQNRSFVLLILFFFMIGGSAASVPPLPANFNPATCAEDAKKPENAHVTAYAAYPCASLEVAYRWQPTHDTLQNAVNSIPHAGSNLSDSTILHQLKDSLAQLSGAAHRLTTDYRRPPKEQEPRDLLGDYLSWSQKLFAERSWDIPTSIPDVFDSLDKRASRPFVDSVEQQAILSVASERANGLLIVFGQALDVAFLDQSGFAQDRKAVETKKAEALDIAAHSGYGDQVSRRAKDFRGFGWLLFSAALLSAFGVFITRRWLPGRSRAIAFVGGTAALFVAQLIAGGVWTLTGIPLWMSFVFLLFVFGIIYVLFRDKLNAWMPGASVRGTHGSAAWSFLADALRLGRVQPKGMVLAESYGFALGRVPGSPPTNDPRLRFMGHVLTCAPTGAGKGIGAVIPTLLEYPGSAVVLDIKGENFAVTARARRDMGHSVYLVDPFGATGAPAQCFNLLDTLDLTSPDVVGQASSLAEMLVISGTNQDDNSSHFNDSAKDLIRGLLVYVAGLDDPARRTLGEVRRILTLPLSLPEGDDRECLVDHLSDMATDAEMAFGIPFRAANGFQSKDAREASGVHSTALRHTAFLDDPRITAAWSRSDFSFRDLKRQPMTVYVVMPPDRLAANTRFMRGIVGAALSAITATQEKPAYNVLFLLDEFAQLGRMQSIEDAISLVRGYGARFWLFVQDLSQLKGVYPKWGTFLANSAKQFYGTADYETAKYVSDMLGQETIEFRTSGDSASTSMQGGSSGSSSSQQVAARSLLTPDEVLREGPTRPIVLIQGERPYRLDRINYLVDPEYVGLADTNPFHG